MSLEDVVRLLRTYWRSIVVTFLTVTAAGTALFMLQPPVYTSTATVNFLPQADGSAGQLAAAMDYAVTQAQTYAGLVNTEKVLGPVAEALGVDSVAGVVHASAPGELAAIYVSATSSDPTYAQDVAAATADQLLIAFSEFTGSGGPQAVTGRDHPAGGAPLGALQSQTDAGSRDRCADRARVGHRPGIPAPRPGQFDRNAPGRGPRHHAPTGRRDPLRPQGRRRVERRRTQRAGILHAGRGLSTARTNLQFLVLNQDNNTVVITSSIPGEGKTETSSQLAKTLSEAGSRVLLVDCDLRRPQVAKHYDLDNVVGLTSALLHNTPVADLVQHVEGLDVLPSGPIPPNPSELLGSRAMKDVISRASEDYDLVILDTPPVLPVTDVAILAQEAGGVVVIADSTKVKRGQLKQAMNSLDAVNANVYGVVLNKLKPSGGGYGYGYGYGYSYSYAYGDEGRSKSRSKGRRVNGANRSSKQSGRSKGAKAGRRSA